MDDLKDVALAQHVQSLLGADQFLATYPIKVIARNGTVFLSGAVGEEGCVKEAEVIARGAPGVRNVVNEIRLR
ncbi:MAG: BON domain-containing protein [Bacillota bacterium]|jgi:osmotically-inducible protein OsmY